MRIKVGLVQLVSRKPISYSSTAFFFAGSGEMPTDWSIVVASIVVSFSRLSTVVYDDVIVA